MHEFFRMFARKSAEVLGSAEIFLAALVLIVGWAVTGPYYGYSDTWQLVINTVTTLITFLMVFIIQNTQNRNDKAVHLKLDELIRGLREARTGLVRLEDLSDEQLADLEQDFQVLRARANGSDAPQKSLADDD